MEFQSLQGGDSPSVMIALPNMNDIKTELVFRLLHWFSVKKYNLFLYAPIKQIPHDRARNLCHRKFLTDTDCEYIWWIDSDVVPPYNALDKLLGYDKDIVSLTVPMLHSGNTGVTFEPQALRYDEEEKAFYTHFGQGLDRVDVTCMGCVLIKRKVMEDVGKGAFDFAEKEEGDGWNIARWGEDLYFGLKYMKAGYEAWNDFDTVCNHYHDDIGTASINYLIKKIRRK